MAIKPKEERVTFRIDVSLKEKAEEIADEKGISLSELIRRLIEDFVKIGRNLT